MRGMSHVVKEIFSSRVRNCPVPSLYVIVTGSVLIVVCRSCERHNDCQWYQTEESDDEGYGAPLCRHPQARACTAACVYHRSALLPVRLRRECRHCSGSVVVSALRHGPVKRHVSSTRFTLLYCAYGRGRTFYTVARMMAKMVACAVCTDERTCAYSYKKRKNIGSDVHV